MADREADAFEVSVREFRENLSGFLRKTRRGQRYVVTSHGTPVAELGPPTTERSQPRPFGSMRGQIRMAPDFDETPPDLIEEMESGLIPGSSR